MNAVLPFFAIADWIRWLMPTLGDGAAEPLAPVQDDDAAWLARVAGGDEPALQRLFDKWKLPLLSFFYRSLGSHADAEDLTLEVFVRLHRAAGDYRPTAKFSTYLFHIAQNLVRNEYRRRRRKPAESTSTASCRKGSGRSCAKAGAGCRARFRMPGAR